MDLRLTPMRLSLRVAISFFVEISLFTSFRLLRLAVIEKSVTNNSITPPEYKTPGDKCFRDPNATPPEKVEILFPLVSAFNR